MTERFTGLSLELDSATEQLARQAAALSGFDTLKEFIQQAVLEKSNRILQQTETITLSCESFRRFKANCEFPGTTNEALASAMRRRVLANTKTTFCGNG